MGENVAFPLRERRDLSEEQILQIVSGLLEMVGVKPMADLFPSDHPLLLIVALTTIGPSDVVGSMGQSGSP